MRGPETSWVLVLTVVALISWTLSSSCFHARRLKSLTPDVRRKEHNDSVRVNSEDRERLAFYRSLASSREPFFGTTKSSHWCVRTRSDSMEDTSRYLEAQ
jgi:hypothetical protein